MLKSIEYYIHYTNVEHDLKLFNSLLFFRRQWVVFLVEFSTQNDPDIYHVILCLSYFYVGIAASCFENNPFYLEEHRITSNILTLDDRNVEATGTFC